MRRDLTPDESELSDHSLDPRQAVEVAVKGQNLFYAVHPHDCEVNGVSCRQIRMADDDIPSALDYLEIYR